MGDNTAPMKTIDLGPLNDVIQYADNLRIAAEAKKRERNSDVIPEGDVAKHIMDCSDDITEMKKFMEENFGSS